MKLLHRKPAARRGFTLVEMVVVIAVIAILVALVAGAVINILGKGPVFQDRSDITALTAALQQFKAKYGYYPPSRFFLANSLDTYKNNIGDPLVKESFAWLNTMFPSMSWAGIDWSGGLGIPANPGYVILEGDQCLVFFLGGIPSTANNLNACLGFSRSPTNPTAPGGDRLKFYDFQPARLASIHGNAFFSYLNPYSSSPVAYAYFSTSRRGQNQYNSVAGTGLGAQSASYKNGDCNFTTTSLKVDPYASSWTNPPAFLNPESFQLISAGADGKFGPGTTSTTTVWSPTKVGANVTGPGRDDMSNFSDRILGESQ
jgi:prepilin-type N-terminal cleavage/methylation domain-containing protein